MNDDARDGAGPEVGRVPADAMRAQEGGAARSAPSARVRAAPELPYPTVALLKAILLASAIIFGAWTALRFGAELDPELYKGGVIGLFAATLAHLLGALAGAALAPSRGAANAYLASTLARFVLTPIVAVSLYFLLLARPQPVLIGAAAGYLLILVADIGTMLKAMQTSGTASR